MDRVESVLTTRAVLEYFTAGAAGLITVSSAPPLLQPRMRLGARGRRACRGVAGEARREQRARLLVGEMYWRYGEM